MSILIVSKSEVGGEFQDTITIDYKQKKTNKIELKIGGGLFKKPVAKFNLPDDMISYTYEYSEKEEASLGKSILQLGLLAATGEMTSSAIKSGKGGSGAALLGAATARMGTTSTNSYMDVTIQFKDKRILCMEFTGKDWNKFDTDLCIVNFPSYEKETQKQINAVNEQIDEIRNSFSDIPKENQKEATATLASLGKSLPTLTTLLEERRKLAIKRKVPMLLENNAETSE